MRRWQQEHLDQQPLYYALYTSTAPELCGIKDAKLLPKMLDRNTLPKGYYAISENLLHGFRAQGFEPGDLDCFHSISPTTAIGYSIHVFEIEEPQTWERDRI
ncbi:hypothetical protein Q31a_03550 [Aureliella helgolandensis]|uniref:Uncharacterized protein n=1 Tax=Aureliella helgolandensis TaxID=2527968 RepID=A0A518G0H5_9BACT|nr:hypothetical protein Q31a_03550 [Aureliella helgolandensis]